jgi:hypothetical protein
LGAQTRWRNWRGGSVRIDPVIDHQLSYQSDLPAVSAPADPPGVTS